MSAIQIRKATREGARVVLMLVGPSGCGKTRTALEIGLGLARFEPGKIGFIDTENRRGSLFADVYSKDGRTHRSDDQFLIADLFAPFSPERYVEAIHAFQRAGVEVLIIDSGSHEWEGIGGCIEIAEGGNPNKPNWAKGKREHKRFMNALLTCDMHVILCLRGREKAKPEMQRIEGKDKLVYVPLGMQAITEQNVLYEATASLILSDRGMTQDVVKCDENLLGFLGRGSGYLTPEDGAGIRAWVDGGMKVDPKVEKFRNRLISITDQGVAHVEKCWAEVPAAIQKKLGAEFKSTLVASAKEYERLASGNEDDPGLDDLNRAVAGAGSATPVAANDNTPGDEDASAAD